MPDYSEFPTTPTAWQEKAWQDVAPLALEDPPPPPQRRGVDLTALVPGLLFIALAVLLMAGVDVTIDWFGHGIAWVLLIGAGVALLVNELRRSRRRR